MKQDRVRIKYGIWVQIENQIKHRIKTNLGYEFK